MEEEREITLVSLILKRSQGYDVSRLGHLLSLRENIPLADATSKVRYCRGVFGKSLPLDEAKELQEKLKEIGEDSLIVPMGEYIGDIPVFYVAKAYPEENYLRIILGYREKKLEWEKIISLNFVSFHQILSPEEEKKASALGTEEFSLATEAVLEDLEYFRHRGYHLEFFFDLLYLEGPALYRFPYKRLSFPKELCLYSHSMDNFFHFFLYLADLIPSEKHTESTQYFLERYHRLENMSKEEKKSNIDRPRILDGTVFYKKEELQNYYEWLVHVKEVHKKRIPLSKPKREEEAEKTTSKETFFSSFTLRGPIILAGLGAFYFPLSLYLYAVYKHAQGKPALSLNIDKVETIFWGSALLGSVVILLGHKLWKWGRGYIVSLWVIAASCVFSYPWILAKTKEYQIRAEIDKAKIQKKLYEYYSQYGKYPEKLENLFGTTPLDPWGNPWVYQVTPSRKSYHLFSKGADGIAGTKDDL